MKIGLNGGCLEGKYMTIARGMAAKGNADQGGKRFCPYRAEELFEIKGQPDLNGTPRFYIQRTGSGLHLKAFEIPEPKDDEVWLRLGAFIASQELSQTIAITNC